MTMRETRSPRSRRARQWLAAAIAVTAALASLAANPANAAELSLDVGLESAYVWRGIVLTDGPVLEPSLTLSFGAFEANAWFNVDLDDDSPYNDQVNEADYSLAYTAALHAVDLTLAASSYSFPNTGTPSTQELSARVAFRTTLSPAVTVVRDVGEIQAWYVLVTASHTFKLVDSEASEGLQLSAGLGHGTREYAHGYFPDADAGGVTDLLLRLELPLRLGPGTLIPNLQYTDLLESQIHTPDLDRSDATLAGGVTYSVTF